MSSEDLFKSQGYTKFDDKGIPTHKGDEELGKGPRKKLTKALGAHKKANAKLAADQPDVEAYLAGLRKEVADLEAALA